jgi:hypothetical protein
MTERRVEARCVGGGRRVAVVMGQAALAAAASSTPVPSTLYGPTSRISRAESAFLVVVVIGTSFQFGLEVVCAVL